MPCEALGLLSVAAAAVLQTAFKDALLWWGWELLPAWLCAFKPAARILCPELLRIKLHFLHPASAQVRVRAVLGPCGSSLIRVPRLRCAADVAGRQSPARVPFMQHGTCQAQRAGSTSHLAPSRSLTICLVCHCIGPQMPTGCWRRRGGWACCGGQPWARFTRCWWRRRLGSSARSGERQAM